MAGRWECLRRRLLALAPERSPLVWIVVNMVCLAATILTLCFVLVATDDLSQRPAAAALCLVWDFGTTAVWCLEVGLSVAFIRSRSDGRLPCAKLIELVLAVYFLLASMQTLWVWKIRNQSVHAELLNVGLNLVGYMYISYETCRSCRGVEDASEASAGPTTSQEASSIA